MLIYKLNEDEKSYTVTGESDLSVSRIVIPDTYNGLPITKIYGNFFECENLKEIVVGNNVENTGEGTFDLPSLERIYFGRNVKTVYGPMTLAEKLTDIYFSGTEEEWENINFVFIDDSISVIYNAKKHFGILGKAGILSFGEEKIFPYTHWDCIKGKPESLDAKKVMYDNSTSGLLSTDVKNAIDELNAKHFDVTALESWTDLLHLVRSGRAKDFINVGDQFVSRKGDTELVWDVIGIDVDTPSDEEKKHSLTLQLNSCYIQMPYACPEASYFAAKELKAGRYYIRMKNYASGSRFYVFTLKEDLPAGGLLRISSNKLYVYKSRNENYYTSYYIDSSSTSEDNMSGTFLTQENYQIHVEMGELNYMYSDVRNWLNSEEDNWWHHKNDFSLAPVDYLSVPGFCKDMDEDFLNAVNPVKKKTVLWDGSEIVTEDKFFLLSAEEVYATEGNAYAYYKENSSLSAPGAEADSARVKRCNSALSGWWLRTPAEADKGMRKVYIDGAVTDTKANNITTLGIAPACCIC